MLKEFNIRDKVMFNLRNFKIVRVCNNKLGPKRVRPFTITQRIEKLAYQLNLPSTYRMHNVFSIAKLKPAMSHNLNHSHPPGIVEEAEGEYFEVKNIVAHRYCKQKLEYLVKWKDYKDASNS